jgi:uncharacterized iron-regulated membrane protein
VIRILLLGLVLAGVWYLYRMVTQQNATAAPPVQPANDAAPVQATAEAATEAGAEQPASEQAASEQAAALEEAAIAEAQEMIECPVCQAYVPETAHDGCGRPDCPIPALAADRARG